MKKKIVVLDTDDKHCLALCAMLEERQYRAIPIHSLANMEKYIQVRTCLAVILDIETESVDNRIIRKLTINNPEVYFFGMSSHSYNPEFREAICYHIYACLNKPVNPDELFFWLRSINENDTSQSKQQQD